MKVKPASLLFAVVVAMGVVTACGEQAQPPRGSLERSADTAERSEVKQALSDDKGMLTIRPGEIEGCLGPSALIAADVEWNASSANVDGIHIYIQSPGEEPKLWTTAGPIGKERTGEWLRSGSVIRMLDGSQNELAALMLSSTPCQKS